MKKLGILATLIVMQGLAACGGGEQEETATQDEILSVGQRCGGVSGLACRAGEYCDLGVGRCDVVDAMGTCRRTPAACTTVHAPVCGCDGKTYPSACAAAMAAVSIDHAGACAVKETRCGGIAGDPCPAGQFCELPVGQCRVADATGVCRVIPRACTDVVQPVCGCDQQTYPNACAARAASMSLDHAGSCIHIQ